MALCRVVVRRAAEAERDMVAEEREQGEQGGEGGRGEELLLSSWYTRHRRERGQSRAQRKAEADKWHAVGTRMR